MSETKFYKKIFLTAGLADYGDDNEGLLLLSKKTIDEAIDTLKNKDVIITHEGVNSVGKVVDVYFDNEKGAFVCGFNVWTEEAKDLLDNQDYSISCSYNILEKGEGGTYHHIPYDEEAKKIEFENIAIVKNPRYQEAREVLNSIKEEKEEIENGGKGSGNWGHKGRPGQIGGSGKGGNNKERIKHGRILGQIARALKDNKRKGEIKRNLATKIKDVRERVKGREKQIMADIKRQTEENFNDLVYNYTRFYKQPGKMFEYMNDKIKPEDFDVEAADNIAKEMNEGDTKYTEAVIKTIKDFQHTNVSIEDIEKQAEEEGKKLDNIKHWKRYDTIAAKNEGLHAVLNIVRFSANQTTEGLDKEFSKLIRERRKNLKERTANRSDMVKSVAEYLQENKITRREKQQLKDKVNNVFKGEYNYDINNDKSDDIFKDMKKNIVVKYGDKKDILQKTLNKNIIPSSMRSYIKEEGGKITASYWEGGEKKRIYFNVFDKDGDKVYFDNNYIEIEQIDKNKEDLKKDYEKQKKIVEDLEKNREDLINKYSSGQMELAREKGDFSSYKHPAKAARRLLENITAEQRKKIDAWLEKERNKLYQMEDLL